MVSDMLLGFYLSTLMTVFVFFWHLELGWLQSTTIKHREDIHSRRDVGILLQEVAFSSAEQPFLSNLAEGKHSSVVDEVGSSAQNTTKMAIGNTSFFYDQMIQFSV